MLEKDGIIVGTGSACSSKNPFSRVLKEAGHDNKTLESVFHFFTPFGTPIASAILLHSLKSDEESPLLYITLSVFAI